MKKMAFAFISIGFILAFSACKWEVPQNVSVKSEAEYNFSLGKFDNDLNEQMGLSSMLGDLDGAPVLPYDYFPGKKDKNTQHYLLEIKVLDEDNLADGLTIPLSGNVNVSELGFAGTTYDNIGLNFNPSTILTSMKEALGGDMDGKIEFADVPMYLYCETIPGITANITMRMFYGNKADPIDEILGTSKGILHNSPVQHTPKPVYQKDGDTETIITDLAATRSVGEAEDVKDIMNVSTEIVSEDDQLCVECNINSISGTVDASLIQNGIPLKLYAVIDLPLSFNALDDVKMDVNSMTQDSENTEASNLEENTPSTDSEFSKYLSVVESISIKYVAYQLPFYATTGMKLGFDMAGNGSYAYSKLSVVSKDKTITEEDKSTITLPYTTIERIRANSTFKPNIQLLIQRDSVFAIPRDKAVEMAIDLNLTTDGIVQVK